MFGKGAFGSFAFIKFEMDESQKIPKVSTKEHLEQVYEGVRKGMLGGQRILISEQSFQKDKIWGNRFSYNNGLERSHVFIFLVKDVMYAFQYDFLASNEEAAKEEMYYFFRSIIVSPTLTIHAQLNNYESPEYKEGFKIGIYIRYVFSILLFVGLLVLFLRKKK
jgi:hypothetical protein